MASNFTRSLLSRRPINTISLSSFNRLLSSSSPSISCPPSLPTFARPTRPALLISHAVRVISPISTRMTAIRCRVNRSGGGYSPLNSSSNFSYQQPPEYAPVFPGCDNEHWLIVMDKPGGEGANKQQMIDCYIQTLAKVPGRSYELEFPF